jgi:hypothetical protein
MLSCAHCGGALHCDVNTGHRYYLCLRNKTHWARKHGVAPCPLPAVPSGPLEALAWEQVVETLLDPDRLSDGLRTARAEYASADGRRAARLQTLEAETARLRARLERVLEEQLDAPSGSESARLLREKGKQIEDALSRFQAERARLEAEPMAGLSESQVVDLTRFADEVRAGLDVADNLARRRVLQMLKLRGVVRLDPEHGIRLAKRNRYSIEWEAIIRLQRNEREFTNIQTIWVGPAKDQAPAKTTAE